MTVKVLRAVYKTSCYVLFSSSFGEMDKYGDKPLKTITSFLYDAGKVAAEWEPCYGPIQLHFKGGEGESHPCGFDKEMREDRPHYAYPYIQDRPGSWSQISVDRLDMKPHLVNGDFDYIFAVLKDWAESRT
jgi:hypothetical protein